VLGLLGALALAAAPPATDVGTRVRSSAAAAQALQGPLDGGWTLFNRRRQAIFRLRITDPPTGIGGLRGVWRGRGAAGDIEQLARRGGHLTISLAGAPGGGVARLTRRGPDRWFGRLAVGGEDRPVVLLRAR
jgi:hypothetical protein